MKNLKAHKPTKLINVKQIPWSQVKPDDRVFIAGNLIDGFPTTIYGPHYIYDPKRQMLKSGGNKKIFRKDFPFLYKEIIFG
jgi:hypothetical protein